MLGPANWPPAPRVLFVAEAPGRFGGDRTGVPLEGDRSGTNFAALLAAAGLDRATVFVTNAVLCNPRDAAGRNARPTAAELRNCSEHLAAQIAALSRPGSPRSATRRWRPSGGWRRTASAWPRTSGGRWTGTGGASSRCITRGRAR